MKEDKWEGVVVKYKCAKHGDIDPFLMSGDRAYCRQCFLEVSSEALDTKSSKLLDSAIEIAEKNVLKPTAVRMPGMGPVKLTEADFDQVFVEIAPKRATPELCANLGATAPDPGERTIAPPWADSFALRREELAKAWDDGMSAVKGATNPWRTKP